ncbi:MAG: hypothetical protein R6T83_04310, partial [Salinibacter sp.]
MADPSYSSVDASGGVRMTDVSQQPDSARTAVAVGRVHLGGEAFRRKQLSSISDRRNNSMSYGEPGDRHRTLKKIESSISSAKYRPNRLLPLPGFQSASIDQMILEGKYLIQDMAEMLDEDFGAIN